MGAVSDNDKLAELLGFSDAATKKSYTPSWGKVSEVSDDYVSAVVWSDEIGIQQCVKAVRCCSASVGDIVALENIDGRYRAIAVKGCDATSGSYTLPTASASVLGGVKVGANLSISNGVLSATNAGTDEKVKTTPYERTDYDTETKLSLTATTASSQATGELVSMPIYVKNKVMGGTPFPFLYLNGIGTVYFDSAESNYISATNYTGNAATASAAPWSGITDKPSWIGSSKPSYTYSEVGAAASNHTHNYAGSSTSGGAATSAAKLTTSAGSTSVPVYFKDGKPVACSTFLSTAAQIVAGGYDNLLVTGAGLAQYVENYMSSTGSDVVKSKPCNPGGGTFYIVGASTASTETGTLSKWSGLYYDTDAGLYIGTSDGGADIRFQHADGHLSWGSGKMLTSTDYTGNAATATTATSATKLTTSAGSASVPVYFSNGKPVACSGIATQAYVDDAIADISSGTVSAISDDTINALS